MQAKNIKSLTFGCRLNALESEKIQSMLKTAVDSAIIVNSCAVTAEAERQSGQAVRKLVREHKNVPVFVTGCAATRNPLLFSDLPNVFVIHNQQKLNLSAYLEALKSAPCHYADDINLDNVEFHSPKLSKKFIQVQNGCNHNCAYCVTRLLRGPAVSFPYDEVLEEARQAIKDGFYEIVLTGVDTASYVIKKDGKPFLLSDLCKQLLLDVPEIKRLRLSSLDPASPEVSKIIELIKSDNRMMPHIHLSMQSGSDTILNSMHRRHNAEMVRNLVRQAGGKVSFGWDIICGFPGENQDLFNETVALAKELKPIKIHAFPFSPRPDTEAEKMSGQVDRKTSKQRVKIISDIAQENCFEFMKSKLDKTEQVLVEESNMARTPDDLAVKIVGDSIKPKTICNVLLTDIKQDYFIGTLA